MQRLATAKLSTGARVSCSHNINGNIYRFSTGSTSYSDSSSVPPKKGKGFSRLFFALFGTTALTTATLAYAKHNQDVRDIIKDYVPGADTAIAIMYAEKDAPLSSVVSTIRDVASSANDLMFGSAPEKSAISKALPEIKPIISPAASKTAVSINTLAPEKGLMPPPPLIAQTPVSKPPEKIIIEDILTIETVGNEAIGAYRRAIEIHQRYIKKFDLMMENCNEEIDQRVLNDLKKATIDEEGVKNDIDSALKKLDEALSGGKGPVATQMRLDVEKARDEFEKANAAAQLSSRYWPQVEKARKHFMEELQAVYPHVDVGRQMLDIRGANPDPLLMIALRRVILYEHLMARQDAYLTRRVENALTGTDEDLIKSKVEIEMDKERRNLALKYQKKEIALRLEAKRVMETELKKQLDVHSSHIQDAVDKCTKEVIIAERRAAEERSELQRADHELKMAEILGRSQGVDEALKARSDADKMARQSQKLWAACEALESALRRDTSDPMPLSKELDAIASVAADSDELVSAVIRSVPGTIRVRGVYSELALRERFHKVDTACRRVALVPEEGASLPVYFLSWLQSVFLIKGSSIPKDELNDQPTDFSKLDTHDILERVGYWVERCNWAQALRYVQLLKGAPNSVARDWANEVVLHLEARQAARVLLAHASATGLLHL